jgi:predicted histone-like DNA-binding protein
MQYRLIWRVNPQDRTKKNLDAVPVNNGTITESDLKKEISIISSLSKGDVANIIDSITEVVPKYLIMGKSVSLGNIGTLRTSFSSAGVDNHDDFRVSMIGGVKFLLTPSTELKKQVRDIHFELDNSIEITTERSKESAND